MQTFFSYLVIAAMAATGIALALGIIDMLQGKKNREKSTRLMQYRVLFQGIALLLLGALFYTGKH